MLENTGILANYQNSHYKSDYEYAIRIAKRLLTLIGIWPLQRGDSFLDRAKTFVQIATVFGLMCFLLIPHVIYTFHDCEDLKRYMKVIAAQVFSLLAIIKFWTMIVNRDGIKYCLTEMEAHYRDVQCEEDRLVMTKSAETGRFFTTLYLGLSYGGALPYHIILPLMSEKIVMGDNTTRIPLPYLSNYVFFAIEDSPMYEVLFVSQIAISSLILSTNCGIYSLIATIAMHSCGLFEVVSRKTETFLEHGQAELHCRLRDVVRHHLRAIEFAMTIEKALSIVFLSEMVGCTIIICFLEYGVLLVLARYTSRKKNAGKEWEDHNTLSTVTYFVLMTSIFVNVFIISFIGDRLKQESERVGEASYFMPWYDLPEDVVNNIKIIILRTSRPMNLTAGKLFDLSLQGFCDVCKTSAAYFNFLQAMTA